MSEQMTNADAFHGKKVLESSVLAQLLYLGLKYGHGLDVNMELFTHPLNEQSCQIVLFLFP